ncbi:MAG: tandem-95 repeat protein [Candidatus Cloacimonetes bacterium]|nr:tandem-95 repeat protein [Candidatus Cloacimonadota bacterium]
MKMKKSLVFVFMFSLLVSLQAVAPDWEVIPGTQYSLQMYSQVDYLGDFFTNDNPDNIVAAFGPGGETDCRSIAFWNEYNEFQLWYMTIVSNAADSLSEVISFKIYDAAMDQVLDCRESILFQDNVVIGSFDDTFLLTIPYVIDDLYGTYEDSLLIIQLESGVLINDYISQEYIDEFWVVLNQDVSHGVLNFNSDGSFDYMPTLNYFGSDFFEYYATDGVYVTSNAIVEIQIQPVNDPPNIDLPDEGFQFPEDTIYQVDFTPYISDVDNAVLTLTYSGNNYIQITVYGYFVTFTPEADFNGTEYIQFTINDNTARAIDSETIPVTVTPINDPPTLDSPIADFSFNEDQVDNHINLNEVFTDIDGDFLYFNVLDNINLNVFIDSYGLVTISSNQPNWNGSETIIFSAADMEYTVFDTVTVTVLPVNDPPYIITELPDLELVEDFEDILVNLDEHFDDIDDDELYYSAQFNNDHVLIGIAQNMMTIYSVLNWTGITQVVISAQDDFNIRYTVRDTFLITVTGVNDPPFVLTPLPDTQIQEDATAIQRNLDNYFDDYDDPILNYSVEFVDTEMTAWVEYNILYFHPVADWNGVSIITVTASDNYNYVSDSFNVTVLAVNDAPIVYMEIPDMTLEENFPPFDVNLYDHFADVDSENLIFTYSLNVQPSVIVSITEEIMTISSVAQWNGSVDVTVTAQDETGAIRLTVSDVFNISVEPVNNSPYLITPFTDFNVSEDFGSFDVDLTEYFTDPENDPLTYTLVYDEYQIYAVVNGDILTISSVFNWNGTAPVTIYASDEVLGNDPAMDSFNIIVQPVNDPPYITVPIDDYYVLEDFDPIVIDLNQHFADYDDILNFAVDYDADVIQASISMGFLTIYPNLNVFGDTEVLVNAGDGHRVQIYDAFWIYIAPVNDPPEIMLPDSFEFYEDTSLVLDFADYIEDIDSETLILTAEGNTNVLIDINGLTVTFTNVLNWNGSEVVTFHVYDGEFLISDDVLVVVIPQADVLTISLPPTFTFDEDESLTVNFAPYISNPDGFDIELSYAGADWVTVDINNLIVTLGAYPDWNGTDDVTFTISNIYGPEFSSDIVNVIVLPINDPPTVTPIPDQYIMEDSGTSSINLNTYFSDIDGDVLQYSANFDDDALIVEIAYPNLFFEPLPDWFGTTAVIVTAQDVYTRYTVRDTFDVIVEPVNDAPYIVTYFNDRTKNEDFLPFTIDFTGYFNDVDNEMLYYSVDFNSEEINVVLNGTVLEISSLLNWNGITAIAVTASDLEYRLSVTDEFLLTVNPVNDPPVLISPLEDLTLLEDFEPQFIDLSYHFYDPDNTITYSVNASADEIGVSIISGYILRLNSINDWYGTTTVEVTANDLQGRAYVIDDFDVIVEPVNDAPIVLNPLDDLNILEDTISEEINLNLNFFDVDGDVLIYSAEVSDPNGIVVIDQNIMTVSALENWNGSFDVTITAEDNMNRLFVTDLFQVLVSPVNDPPFIVTPLPDLEFQEDFEPYLYDLSQNYDDIECDVLYYNSEYNSDHIALMLDGSIMQINSINDWSGTTQVIIFISDQICREVITDTFLVTVYPLNDPPYVANPIPNQTKYEDFVTFSLNLDLYFTDVDEDILYYSAVANDTIVTLDIQDNLLFISSVPDLNGYVDITVTADDGYNRLTASDIFTLNVIPVNDPPMLMLPDQYDFDEDTSLVLDLVETGCICDIDNDPADLDLNVSGGVNVIIVIQGTVVTFSATNNWFGQEDLVFSLSDETYVVFDTVTVIVNPVNDPPVFVINIPDQQILEGNLFNTINLNYYVTDVDDPDPTLLWNYSGNVDLIVNIDPVTHIAIVSAPDPDWNGNENITFTVTDPYYASASDEVNFEIVPVNDAPIVIMQIPDQYVEINFAPFDIDLSYYFYDVDGDQLTYQAAFNPEEIMISELNGIITINSIVNWYGVSEVIVAANDNVTRATVTDTFLVNITHTITQPVPLGVMWNWISFYVQPDDYSLEYVFGPLGDNVNTVKYQYESADYYPEIPGWFGDLQAIQDGGGYLVNVDEPVFDFSLTGNRIMSDTPIDMITDWNWIAYYPPDADSLSSALYSILDNVHIVKNQTQSAEYFPEVGNGIWFGDLESMAPGIGYKVDMFNSDTLIYPLYPVITRNQPEQARSLPDNAPEDWVIMKGTSDNMIAMLNTEIDGENYLWTPENAVGVFDENGICRAHGIWQESDVLDQGFWYFTVVGNNNEVPLRLRILCENDEEFESSETFTFLADSKIGDPFDPVVFTFNLTAEDENDIVTVNCLAQNYPNPFNPVTTISFSLAQNDNVEVSVYNLRGEIVKVLVRELRDAGSYSVIWDGSDNKGNDVASGVYFYSIKTSTFAASRKMVMIK